MQERAIRVTKLRFSCIVCLIFLFNPLTVVAQDQYLCVWRNPERTMTRIFPDARDYKSVSIPISIGLRKVIEDRIGFELLPGQQDRFQYYEMTGDKGQVVGTIIAASQKGEYGAVEFVLGLDTDMVLKEIYIQRSRERDQSFKKRDFLDRFVGRSIKESTNFNQLQIVNPTPGTTAVIRGLNKELSAFEVLVMKNSKNIVQ